VAFNNPGSNDTLQKCTCIICSAKWPFSSYEIQVMKLAALAQFRAQAAARLPEKDENDTKTFLSETLPDPLMGRQGQSSHLHARRRKRALGAS
jgi:hypothetical protein